MLIQDFFCIEPAKSTTKNQPKEPTFFTPKEIKAMCEIIQKLQDKGCEERTYKRARPKTSLMNELSFETDQFSLSFFHKFNISLPPILLSFNQHIWLDTT